MWNFILFLTEKVCGIGGDIINRFTHTIRDMSSENNFHFKNIKNIVLNLLKIISLNHTYYMVQN